MTKTEWALEVLRFCKGNITQAKAMVANTGERISARTWNRVMLAYEHPSTFAISHHDTQVS